MTETKNLPASVHRRLADLARAQSRPFQEYLYYYIMERFLYRLVRSPYADKFVLKGGLMYVGWGLPVRRPTRDIDLQGFLPNSEDYLAQVVKEICLQDVEPDGLRFDPASVRAERVMENTDYHGVRVYFEAHLGSARQQTHLDVSIGNVITPSPIVVDYPTLLGMPSFKIRGYPYETVIAEKFQTMVYWEIVNDRLFDFYDIHLLSQQVEIQGATLVAAITATFTARRTRFPDATPIALTSEFARARNNDWRSFLNRSLIEDPQLAAFEEIIRQLRLFLLPPLNAARDGLSFPQTWPPRGPWTG